MSADSTCYYGDFLLENGGLKQYSFAGGYITGGGSKAHCHYYIRDHQGNNRVVVSDGGVIEQTTHYYPYGGIMSQSTGQGVQKYKYNAKELDRTHGLDWYDYVARQYDPAIARFTSMDPLCEKYYSISPYAYCAGNPIRYVDADGRFITILNGTYSYNIEKRWFVNSQGEKYDGTNSFVNDISSALGTICEKSKAGCKLVTQLVESASMVNILSFSRTGEFSWSDDNGNKVSCVGIDPNGYFAIGGDICAALAHELQHSFDRINGTLDMNTWTTYTDKDGNVKPVPRSEISATFLENLVRVDLGLPLRETYLEIEIIKKLLYLPDRGNPIIENGRSLYYDKEGNHLPDYGVIPDVENRYIH